MSGAERGLRSPDARAFNAPLYPLSYLGNLIWRLVRESNPRLPARQAGTLAAELTRQTIHPVTGSGAAQSSRPISTPKRELDEGSLIWRRVRDCSRCALGLRPAPLARPTRFARRANPRSRIVLRSSGEAKARCPRPSRRTRHVWCPRRRFERATCHLQGGGSSN